MTPKCFKNTKTALAPSTVFCDKKLIPVELRRDTWTTYICSVFSQYYKTISELGLQLIFLRPSIVAEQEAYLCVIRCTGIKRAGPQGS